MKKRLLAALICVLLTATGIIPALAQPHLPLWKVEGTSNTIYLLGSIHMLEKSDYPLPSPILAAFSNAQTVAFESDLDQMAQIIPQMIDQLKLPAGETIQDELSPKAYRDLTNYLAGSGLPVAMIMQFKPSFAAMMLEDLELQQSGLDPADGVDEYFYKRAQHEGKTVIGLEPIESTIKLIAGFSKAQGESYLEGTITDLKDSKKDFEQLIAAWRAGDVRQLDKFLTEAFKDAPDIYKELVTDRTIRWFPEVLDLLSSGKPALIVVGAGHIIGDNGLVEMLKKKGFKVTQMSAAKN